MQHTAAGRVRAEIVHLLEILKGRKPGAGQNQRRECVTFALLDSGENCVQLFIGHTVMGIQVIFIQVFGGKENALGFTALTGGRNAVQLAVYITACHSVGHVFSDCAAVLCKKIVQLNDHIFINRIKETSLTHAEHIIQFFTGRNHQAGLCADFRERQRNPADFCVDMLLQSFVERVLDHLKISRQRAPVKIGHDYLIGIALLDRGRFTVCGSGRRTGGRACRRTGRRLFAGIIAGGKQHRAACSHSHQNCCQFNRFTFHRKPPFAFSRFCFRACLKGQRLMLSILYIFFSQTSIFFLDMAYCIFRPVKKTDTHRFFPYKKPSAQP